MWFVDRYNQFGNQTTGAFVPGTIDPTSNLCLTYGQLAQTPYLVKKDSPVFVTQYSCPADKFRGIDLTSFASALNNNQSPLGGIELGTYLNGLVANTPGTNVNAVANSLRVDCPHFNVYYVPTMPVYNMGAQNFTTVGSYIIKTKIMFNLQYYNKIQPGSQLNREIGDYVDITN
jgi:hypothetical protein